MTSQFDLIFMFPNQGRTQGGLGLNPPLNLIFHKNFITGAKEINCFRILFAS